MAPSAASVSKATARGGPAGSIRNPFKCKPSAGFYEVPFLSNPLDCSEREPTWTIAIDSVEHAGSPAPTRRPRPRRSRLEDRRSSPQRPVDRLRRPAPGRPVQSRRIATKPLQGSGPVQADQPSGLRIDLDFPQSNDPTDFATRFRPGAPAGPPAKGRHRRAARRARDLARPRPTASAPALTSPRTRPATRSATTPPSRSAAPTSSKIGSALATSPLLATSRPDHRRGRRCRADHGRRLPAEAPPRRSRQQGAGRQVPRPGRAREPALRGQLQAPGHRHRRRGDRQDHDSLHREPAAARQPPDDRPEAGAAGAAGDPGHLRSIRERHDPGALVDAGNARCPARAPASRSRRARAAAPVHPRRGGPSVRPGDRDRRHRVQPGGGRQPLRLRTDSPRRRQGAQLPERRPRHPASPRS